MEARTTRLPGTPGTDRSERSRRHSTVTSTVPACPMGLLNATVSTVTSMSTQASCWLVRLVRAACFASLPASALVRAIEKEGRRYIPSETNFLMIDVGQDVEPLIAGFAGKGIKVGRRFAAMPHWLRVTIGKPEETEAFYRALTDLVPAKAAA